MKIIIFLSVLVGAVVCRNCRNYYSGRSYVDCFKPRRISNCNGDSKFRTVDGSCNNLKRPFWGATNTRLARVTRNFYTDGKDTPRKYSSINRYSDRIKLPSPNEISRELFKVEKVNKGNKDGVSTLFMTFGQFLDHDVTEVPTATCKNDSCQNCIYPCFPIPFGKYSKKCSKFQRSRAMCKCRRNKARAQVNTLSAYIDASQIYSPDPKHYEELRSKDGTGKLKISPSGLLPLEHAAGTCRTLGGCSLVGDERGDENLALNTMHTLWVREHNRIAEGLKKLNPHWKEDQIFNTTRRIVGGIWQHIVYAEYLPRLIRNKPYRYYKKNVNPSITQGFATSAFRYGHSLIPNSFSQLNNNFDKLHQSISLQEAFFNRKPINQHGIEPIMFGLIGNQSNEVDTGFAFGIARKLFIRPGENGYLDLTALNIQRGRDHGVAPYGAYRESCNLPNIKYWSQLRHWMSYSAVNAFKKLYIRPYDIDLFAAGIAEKHVKVFRKGKIFELEIGPTFECILRRQFYAVRDGDRFFYGRKKGVFNKSQRNAIEKVTMASIMCRNLRGIVSIQKKAFLVGSNENRRINCDRIPSLDLNLWKDQQSYGDEEEDLEEDILPDDDEEGYTEENDEENDMENEVEDVDDGEEEQYHGDDSLDNEIDESNDDDDLDLLFDKK